MFNIEFTTEERTPSFTAKTTFGFLCRSETVSTIALFLDFLTSVSSERKLFFDLERKREKSNIFFAVEWAIVVLAVISWLLLLILLSFIKHVKKRWTLPDTRICGVLGYFRLARVVFV